MVLGAAVSEHRLGAMALAAGLAGSFMAIGLFLATIGYSLGIDSDHVRLLAAIMLIAVGLLLIVPSWQTQFALVAGPWWPGGKMTGSVQHEGRICSIRHMGGETYAVVEMGEERMPQEHAPVPERMRTNDPNLRDDPLWQEGDATRMGPVRQGMRTPTKSRLPAQEEKKLGPAISKAKPAKTKNDKS